MWQCKQNCWYHRLNGCAPPWRLCRKWPWFGTALDQDSSLYHWWLPLEEEEEARILAQPQFKSRLDRWSFKVMCMEWPLWGNLITALFVPRSSKRLLTPLALCSPVAGKTSDETGVVWNEDVFSAQRAQNENYSCGHPTPAPTIRTDHHSSFASAGLFFQNDFLDFLLFFKPDHRQLRTS